jgi:hypothetical protein
MEPWLRSSFLLEENVINNKHIINVIEAFNQ